MHYQAGQLACSSKTRLAQHHTALYSRGAQQNVLSSRIVRINSLEAYLVACVAVWCMQELF